MYDAPSLKANKLFVASRLYPVEVIVQVDNWTKVRDVAGDLAWVEKKESVRHAHGGGYGGARRCAPKPDDSAPLVFQARQGVALEVVELGAGPWVKVRHRDGQSRVRSRKPSLGIVAAGRARPLSCHEDYR